MPRAIFFSGFCISDPILIIVWNALKENIIPEAVVAANIGAEP
ncbi:Uncharacterised protein [Staphylococcus aureus]|nr:Uncharacterised protein [Staphylococcus aureus]